MELEDSLSHSEQPATGSYAEPVEYFSPATDVVLELS
jgi:hypothetical protein